MGVSHYPQNNKHVCELANDRHVYIQQSSDKELLWYYDRSIFHSSYHGIDADAIGSHISLSYLAKQWSDNRRHHSHLIEYLQGRVYTTISRRGRANQT